MNVYLFLILCFAIGNVMTGYIIVKWKQHKDLRQQGTGNVGARNAGSIYGKSYFIVIFLGDALKGSCVILIAQYFHFSPEVQLLGLSATVIGHIKPIFLGFNGGKGVSTFIGGMAVFAPMNLLIIIVGFVITYPFFKSFTISGLISFLFLPFFLFFVNISFLVPIITAVIVMIIIVAHRGNIHERIGKQ